MLRLFFTLLSVVFAIIAYPQDSIVIPFQIKDNLPFIEITINNEKHNFLFDTGAYISLIKAEIGDEYLIDKDTLAIDINKISQEHQLALIPAFNLVDKEFINTKMLSADLSLFNDLLCETQMDGIIGRDIMKNYIVQIKPAEGKIVLFSREGFNAPENYVKYSYKKFHAPTLKLKIGNKKMYATYDTGSNQGLVVNGRVSANKLKALHTIKVEALGQGIGINGVPNNPVSTSYVLGTTVYLDKLELPNQDIVITNDFHNNMGFKFIKQFNSILDVANKYIYLDKNVDIPNDKKYNNLMVTVLNDPITGKNIIYALNTNANNRLKLGDEVVKINDKELNGLNNCEIRSLLDDIASDSGKKQILFEIKRDDEIKKILLSKEMLGSDKE